MDCAPLNLAHFHERRAEKLIKRHQYDEAYKAVETSMLYVQDAYKNVHIPKSLEVLNTQVWDYERKLQQIKMRKQQYERLKSKEIVPPTVQQNDNTNVKPNDLTNALSIDKTVKDFNEKFGSTALVLNMNRLTLNETEAANTLNNAVASESTDITESKEPKRQIILEEQVFDELPSLAPLELPSFDFSVFMSSSLAENFQK